MEIVTLQFGNLSNHIMTHYWNLQDEQLKMPDETVLRFESLYYETPKGHFPLTLYFDRKDAFGNFSGCFDTPVQDIQEVEQELESLWQGNYEVTQDEYIDKS